MAKTVAFAAPIPVLRMFDIERTLAFYVGYLGFALDWEHRFAPELPLYAQVSRAGLALHLSQHHGDGSPGVVVFSPMTGLEAFHAELSAKPYGFLRPSLERQPWGQEMQVTDPNGNRIRFCERADRAPGIAIEAFELPQSSRPKSRGSRRADVRESMETFVFMDPGSGPG